MIKKVNHGLFGLLTVLVLAFIGLNLLAPNRLMDYFGFRTYAIVSDSMAPVIDVGDLIFITKLEADGLAVGDIVAFEKEGRTVVHYLAEKTKDSAGNNQYRTRKYQASSRAKEEWDYWTLTDQELVGRYRYKIPKVGYVSMFLRSIYGFLSLLVLGVVSLIRRWILGEER